MSIVENIKPNLPYLRRYARALTGTQESGDTYVANVLEAIITDPSQIDEKRNAKLALFHIFSRIWASLDVNLEHDRAPTPAERNVTGLSALPRQAFLLTSLEGFDTAEAAEILECSKDEIATLIQQAGEEIASQVATSILIIEDEPLIAMDIEQLVTDIGHEVTGIARTHTEAVAEIAKRKPGMILADIQLADGSSGIDAVNEILDRINVPVIFITAYPERLLTGERPEPAFLITKPFRPETVKAVISQALFFDQRAGS
ncbi:response regulator [Ahrensia sp. R2A130]|uniref:response regulator n=1 Tax=Ahrensia sp. R2A130 TaxID=744979 RepID=UPI0001E0ACFA|nr:response regulator [Ahrensia sp. R2A130]EFL87757.1 phyllosphere-induced regulator PhyR [Ahrensia sp. R2A130]